MKTEHHSIQDVLAKNATSFFIPPFQRAYAWGKSEIERFFMDVSKIIESELDENQGDKLEHFFGTLVIKEESEGFAHRSIIIDGQQRLTTTLLFLIALRDLSEDQKQREYIEKTYLKNDSSEFQDKIKLKQVTKDWEAYRALVNQQKPIEGNITKSYQMLKKLISEIKSQNPDIHTEHFIIAIKRMNVAVIFLDERPFKGEDPQIIYETLNSLGKPLTLADLIRNYILLNMKSDEQTEVYDNIWYPKIEGVLGENISNFFRDYLQYKESTSLKVVNDNNTKEIYQQFKDYVEETFKSRTNFIDDILGYVKPYKWIITEVNTDIITKNSTNDKEIKELLRNIFHDIKSEVFKPFVLGLLKYHQDTRISDEKLIENLKIIRIYLIRRRVCGLTQGENKNIVLLCKKIEDIVENKEKLLLLLTNFFYQLRLPNDEEITKRLQEVNFYEELKSYVKFILGKIEEKNAKVSVDFRDPKITVEHIMPQKINKEWKKELGENFNEIHKKYLHNIGNLILTEFNSEMGNKSFKRKKDKLKTSSLCYRLYIIDKDYWNEKSILEHQDKMIRGFLDTFPLPEEYRKSNNWKWQTEKTESESFSPFDVDDPETLKWKKTSKIYIENNGIDVNTWQDVFLSFLKNVKENSEEDFQTLIENQKLFGREDRDDGANVFLTLSEFEKLISLDKKWIDRYKTLDGKTYDKFKRQELDTNTIFVHINIGSTMCINRIKSAMDKLNMDRDSVKIKLRDS